MNRGLACLDLNEETLAWRYRSEQLVQGRNSCLTPAFIFPTADVVSPQFMQLHFVGANIHARRAKKIVVVPGRLVNVVV